MHLWNSTPILKPNEIVNVDWYVLQLENDELMSKFWFWIIDAGKNIGKALEANIDIWSSFPAEARITTIQTI